MNRRELLFKGTAFGATSALALNPATAFAANCSNPSVRNDPINDGNRARFIVKQAYNNLNLWQDLDKFAITQGFQSYRVSQLSDFVASWLTTYLGVEASARSGNRAAQEFSGRALSTINNVFGDSRYNDVLSAAYYNLNVDALQVDNAVKLVDKDGRIPSDLKPALKEGLQNRSWVYFTVEILKKQAELYPETRQDIVERLYDANDRIPFLDLADCRKPTNDPAPQNKLPKHNKGGSPPKNR